RPAADFQCQQVGYQLADGGEVTDEGNSGEQGHAHPDAVLGQLAQEFLCAHRALVELHALVAVALGDLLGPPVDPGVHALRAGVAAPDAAGEHGDEEQTEGADDQQPGQQHEVLRPEGGAEDVELAFRQVPPDGLAVAPVQPDGTEIEDEQQRTATQSQVAEDALEGAGVDLCALGVEVDGFDLLGGDVTNGNLVAHQCVPRLWCGFPGRVYRPGYLYLLPRVRPDASRPTATLGRGEPRITPRPASARGYR